MHKHRHYGVEENYAAKTIMMFQNPKWPLEEFSRHPGTWCIISVQDLSSSSDRMQAMNSETIK